ncbi:MAG: DUF2169 domain-containing protein, partial [Planctomycetota bacterium]
MAVLDNKSDFPGELFPAQDAKGRLFFAVALRGTFEIRNGSLQDAEEQDPLIHEDQFFGDPATSSVKFASDLVPYKIATDIAL